MRKRITALLLLLMLCAAMLPAEAFADGVNADRNGTDWRRQAVRVRTGEKIRVSLAPGGGWVARFARVR